MRFRCLGPVEYWAGQAWSPVAGARPRSLLALLLIEAGAPVSVERIAYELWSGSPPRSAATAVRGYALRLRRSLGDAGGELVATRSGGYELRCDRAEVDLYRFLELSRRGEAELARGEFAGARATLAEASGLWRGPAFADVLGTEAVLAESRVLAEHRAAAMIARSEAGLRLGHAAEVVAELRALLGEHPLREELWVRLMRALRAAGRRAEALDAYREARSLLVAELGLEPGAELRAEHRAVLADGAPAAVAARPQVVPQEVARGERMFVGRRSEVNAICDQLTGSPEPPVVVVSGPGGMGKSALAVHVAHRLAGSFPDGRLHLDLAGSDAGIEALTPARALGRLLRALGVDPRAVPGGEEEAAALYRTLTARRRMLVLLDNALDAAQVRPLLPGPSCAVLITCRRALPTLGGPGHRLRPLPPGEATAMLAGLLGVERVSAEPESVARLAELCEYLPLALRVCAARLAARPHWPLRALADRLRDERHRLDELQQDDLTVRASFAVSGRDLAPEQASMFHLLGLARWSELTAPAAAALAGVPVPAAERALEGLVEVSLLEPAGHDRYRLHDLARLYAMEEAERYAGLEAAEPAVAGALRHYVAAGAQATELLMPINMRWLTPGERAMASPSSPLVTPLVTSVREAIAWTDAEHGVLVEAAAQGAAMGEETARLAVTLAGAVSGPLHVRGHWQERRELNEIAVRVARELGDHEGEARSCLLLAYTCGLQGQVGRVLPLLERAHALWQQSGSVLGRARTAYGFGALLMREGELCASVSLLERALAALRELGERYDEVLVVHQLALAYGRLGRAGEELACLREAGELAERIGYRHGAYFSLLDLARTHRRRGESAEAARCLQRALPHAREAGERYGQSELLWETAALLDERGRGALAQRYRDEALDILRDMGSLQPREAATHRDGATRPAAIDHERRWDLMTAEAGRIHRLPG